MGISKASLLSLAAAGIVLAGCQSSRLGNLDNVSPPPPSAPVNAVPAGTVQKGNLDSPTQFPNAPSTDMSAQSGTQVASLPPASAPDLTPGAVAGVWNASLGGQSCKIATPQTKYGQGYRAGPLRCPGELANLASWAVNGKQLVLYDANGGTVASLYSSGQGRFDGQTTGGQAVTLSR
ncbi:outer membrane lipoprotein omp19 [Brucella abortus F6/05-3]|uniref:protease inhibitor Inh/omp19 family protein n=1 Tax=Brucella abortus TaxID=235 RepID=UPI0001B9A378|nr:protease inhibitor Inh/omp19 family protein [Brucella abortus]AIJ55153.1 protease inhibitor Inh family protein [Brucella abortus]AIJ78162.1 protease inhibitor Inh family protein [Brucella abortus]EEX83351.1 outer membrane lipoprotein [Brucella abortus bv. 3 str. Tulya]ENS26287.1 outer membrane lipoprotein omp19 [Brucella abortus F6/05-3]